MKWVIGSDIHGAADCCRQLLEAYRREEGERLLLLGDLLYHGPRNDLPEHYRPKEVLAMLNELSQEIFCVRGNCEAEVDQMVLTFPVMADYCLLESGGLRIFATHGHVFNIVTPPPLGNGDILLHGHTHIPIRELRPDGYWYLNPGSVSLPKANSPKSYMTLEGRTFCWKMLEDGREWDRLEL